MTTSLKKGADKALETIREFDLSTWVKSDLVWTDLPGDVPGLNLSAREALDRKIADLASRREERPGGVPVMGTGGSGKTHLLSHLRQSVFKKGGYFFMADMSAVNDFWAALALEATRSLDRPGGDGQPQRLGLAARVAGAAGVSLDDPAGFFARAGRNDIARMCDRIRGGLFNLPGGRQEAQEHADLARALFFWNSDDPVLSGLAMHWLKGANPPGSPEPLALGFAAANRQDDRWLVLALTWLCSLGGGFSVLAVDQLDSLITSNALQAPTEEERQEAQRILHQVGGGFAALISRSWASLTVATFISSSWITLLKMAHKPDLERFGGAVHLPQIASAETARLIISVRSSAAAKKTGFKLPHDVWPFAPGAFQGIVGWTPRELLQSAARHVETCLREGLVRELASFETPLGEVGDHGGPGPGGARDSSLAAVERCFLENCRSDEYKNLLDPASEDDLWPRVLDALARALVAGEAPLVPPDAELGLGQGTSTLRKSYKAVAFFKYLSVGGNSQDRFFSLWAILNANTNSFKARVTTAVGQSGVNGKLTNRRLAAVRFPPPSPTAVAEGVRESFEKAGGEWLVPGERDLRIMRALERAASLFPDDFLGWAAWRRPALSVGCLAPMFRWLLNDPANMDGAADWLGRWLESPAGEPVPAPVPEPVSEPAPAPVPEPVSESAPATEAGGRDNLDDGAGEKQPPLAAPLRRPDKNAVVLGKGKHKVIAAPLVAVAPEKMPESGSEKETGAAGGAEESLAPPDGPAPKSPPVEKPKESKPAPKPPPASEGAASGSPTEGFLERDYRFTIGRQHGNKKKLAVLDGASLPEQTAIFGGTGSGKTVLLRRIIEGAALQGIPAVVLDISGDLSYLGQNWPDPEEHVSHWAPGDLELARSFSSRVRGVVWTPEYSQGNPLRFPTVPSFAGLDEQDGTLEEAIQLSVESMMSLLSVGASNHLKKGILASALRFMAADPDLAAGGISELRDILFDIPDEVVRELGDKTPNAAKTMGHDINALAKLNPEILEPGLTGVGELFRSPSGRPRISVISTKWLKSEANVQAFAQKLFVSLFTWISKNPGRGLAGLIVLDEAKDFIPSTSSTASKSAVQRLSNQSRKFGYGLVLASQGLNSIDTNSVANCRNIFIGRLKSKSNVEACRKIYGIQGVQALGQGEFYANFCSPDHNSPVGYGQIDTFLCLSWHPRPAPTVNDIAELARRSREVVERGD
ncbi:MAG: DUF87 domain-containing protein [Deltaproteobacteria bacterium]|nr:DUF87 domain-containing protein [Deltaproteobacteria bacterium]